MLDVWRESVLIMDEVDVLLHPLRSELNFPIGHKQPIDLSGFRWNLPMHLLDGDAFACCLIIVDCRLLSYCESIDFATAVYAASLGRTCDDVANSAFVQASLQVSRSAFSIHHCLFNTARQLEASDPARGDPSVLLREIGG